MIYWVFSDLLEKDVAARAIPYSPNSFSQLPFLQFPALQSQSLFSFFSRFYPQFSRLFCG